MGGRVRLVVAYEGTRYHGWQIQPGQTSIQGILEQAFQRMTGLHTRMRASGRTDSGVHARGQVVCLENLSRSRGIGNPCFTSAPSTGSP